MTEPSVKRSSSEIQIVVFDLGEERYGLDIAAVYEIIRHQPITAVPRSPAFVEGIINLRGWVTPLLSLRALLGIPGEQEDRFIVICRHRGLQIGLMINAVSTMYLASGDELEWNVEGNVGVSAHLLLGLYKSGERLISILSIDNLVHGVLQGGGSSHA